MFVFPQPKTVIPWSAIVMAILLTIDFSSTLWRNFSSKLDTEQRIQQLHTARAQVERSTKSMQREGTSLDLPAKNSVKDEFTIELEAEGIKLKMINEATWSAVVKLCVLWTFTLFTLLAYKYFVTRLKIKSGP